MEKEKYGTLECPDCASTVPKTSPNMRRCKPCALAAHGQTGNGLRDRECVMCGVKYKPTGSSQKSCEGCRPLLRRQKNIEQLTQRRRNNGAVEIGTEQECQDCGDKYHYSSGPQKRCRECQEKHQLQQTKISTAKSPKISQYRERARDNFMFDGNRRVALERDNFTCQHCGATEHLHVHHIDGMGTTVARELRNNALENLLTLCWVCHGKVHGNEWKDRCHSY